MIYLWLIPAVAVLSLVLTAVLRRYALSRSIIDIPNARSSHSVPTPRGGGVAIVIAFLVSLPFLGAFDLVPWSQLIAVGGAGALVAVIGFMDDHGHIAARWRLLGHFAAAIWSLAWMGGLPPIVMFGFSLDLYWFGHILAAIYLVWMLNLYNFMDGIEFAFWQLHACSYSDACAARANDRHRVLWSASGRHHSPEPIPTRLRSDPALAWA